MKRFTMFACLTVAMVFAFGSFAGEIPTYVDGHNSVINGGNLELSKAARDTVVLMGPWSELPLGPNGQFEDSELAGGAPNMNGWESVDMTQKTEIIWHVDTYNAVSGLMSAWCGELRYDGCPDPDPIGGYGPNYHELLSFYGQVADVNNPCVVTINATVNHNTETGWDFTNLGYFKAGQGIAYMWEADGQGIGVSVSGSVTYAALEYVGDNSDEVRITWQVLSDGGWDDADCLNPTDGALQIDDITVTMDNEMMVGPYTDDFEINLGNWVVEFPPGVGDYTHIRTLLKDADACNSDYTPTITFLADDIMFDGFGLPSQICQDWCYGNGGYIVNTLGGAAGPDFAMSTMVNSPIMEWPAGYLGGSLLFDVYRHFELGTAASGFFYVWGIRSISTGDPADMDGAPWADRGFVYYGGPDYIRGGDRGLVSLLEPAATHLQVQVGLDEAGANWGWSTDNGTPAPFFDNVRVLAFDSSGPGMSTREIDLAQDNFAANHLLSYGVDYGLNDVRFDMAMDISLATEAKNLPGDSLTATILAVRSSSTALATLVETDIAGAFAPRIMFSLKGNPTFDVSVRTFEAEQDWADLGGVITSQVGVDYVGYCYGTVAFRNEVQALDLWAFDLPDANFLYPGDVIQYYFESWDDLEGDYQSSTLPADVSEFGVFGGPLDYNSSFTVHALPTMEDTAGAQPSILFWNDFANRGGQNEWHLAFESLGLFYGDDYDVYYTNGPSSGVGSGLGGRAAFGQLAGYDAIVYSSGDLASFTISNINYEQDAGDDTGVLSSWLETGGKLLFATGDEIAFDLDDQGGIAATLLSTHFGVLLADNNVGGFLGDDTSPLVTPTVGNSVFFNTVEWVAYGGCRGINTFDAVTTLGDAEQLAYFNDGTTSYAAATRNDNLVSGSTVVYLPYDLMNIRSPEKVNQPAALAARAQVLEEVLFNAAGISSNPGIATGVTPELVFSARNYPNPFNPVTKIEFTMPKAGHLSLKVFNVRGVLVRTLINEVRAEGTDHVMWDGTSDQGKRVSSGVYFYEARTDSDVSVSKMALVK